MPCSVILAAASALSFSSPAASLPAKPALGPLIMSPVASVVFPLICGREPFLWLVMSTLEEGLKAVGEPPKHSPEFDLDWQLRSQYQPVKTLLGSD